MSIKLNVGLANAALSVLLTACNPAGQADRTATARLGVGGRTQRSGGPADGGARDALFHL